MSGDNEAHDVSLKHPQVAAALSARLAAFRAETSSNPRGWLAAGGKE
jgi:hypothetical protein